MDKLKEIRFRNKKKIVAYTLVYLAIGYGIILGLYLLANPGYLKKCPADLAQYKCVGVIGLVKDLAVRSDFWFQVLTWPISAPLLSFGS